MRVCVHTVQYSTTTQAPAVTVLLSVAHPKHPHKPGIHGTERE